MRPTQIRDYEMKQIKSLMVVLMTVLCVGFSSCNKDCDCANNNNNNNSGTYPSLKVVNQHSGRITSVLLVGYEFNTLSINTGQSQTFALDKGMPSGNNNINVSVTYYYGTTRWVNKNFTFINGAVTTITLKGDGTLQ